MNDANSPDNKITGAECAEGLLAVNSPTRLIDHLIERLAAKTGSGRESNLLEFKGTYHKRPDSKDPDSQDCFEWNVMLAFIALANAQGGCVVIGIAETDDHQLVPGDWDPDGILGCKDADGDGKPIPGREEKDLVDHVNSIFFKDKFKRGGRTYQFSTRNKRNPSAPDVAHEFSLDAVALSHLSKLVTFYPCHSEAYACNALAAIVHPVKKDDGLIEVRRKKKNLLEPVVFYRDITAKTCELTTHRDIRHYEERREPASSDFYRLLHGPLTKAPSAALPSFSTMWAPDPHFIGRKNELKRLRETCSPGRIVLVAAPGGTGKTQLTLKFAEISAADYPGGRFFVPVQNATSWDDILRLLIDQHTSSRGQTPEQWLGLAPKDPPTNVHEKDPSREQQSRPTPSSTPDIVNALIRKGNEAGPMLIVLDNLEEPSSLLSPVALQRAFPQGLPNTLSIVATARSTRGVNKRKCPAVDQIELDDISTEEARSILSSSQPFEAPEEQTAADEIIHLLDHRVLYVARIANLATDFTERPYARLLKKFNHDRLDMVKPQDGEDDDRTPLVLWQWAKEAIARSPDGAKDILTLQALALFPPDGIGQGILEALWYADFGLKKGPDILAAYREDPALFQDALKRLSAYGILKKDDDAWTFRMHRLDRMAILKDLVENAPDRRTQLGNAIRECPFVSTKDWVTFAQAHLDLMGFCPWDVLNHEESCRILIAQPEHQTSIVNWEKFDLDDWINLVEAHSEFVDSKNIPPEIRQSALLTPGTRRFDLCDEADLPGAIWVKVLLKDPSKASNCHWERLKKNDWRTLLASHPEMRAYNPHSETFKATAPIVTGRWGLDNYPWGKLLASQEQLCMDICPREQLNRTDWAFILAYGSKSELAANVDNSIWREFNGKEWTAIVRIRPSLLKYYNLECGARLDWTAIITEHPELEDKIPFRRLNEYEWYKLLCAFPKFKDKNPPWQAIVDYLTRNDLWGLPPINIRFPESALFPELEAFLPPLEKLTPYVQTTIKNSQIAARVKETCARFNALKCDEINALDPPVAEGLALNYPCLKVAATFKEKNFSGADLVEHGYHRIPSLINQQQERWHWPNDNLPRLILYPNRLYSSFNFTIDLKESPESPPIVVNEVSECAIPEIQKVLDDCQKPTDDIFIHKYQQRLSSLIRAWAVLLCIRPDFAPACDWSSLDGKDFCLLMVNRPSLARYCDWSKLGGFEWSILLAENPEFADKCDWSTLSPDDWDYLLAERPWMIKYRPKQTGNTTSPSHTAE